MDQVGDHFFPRTALPFDQHRGVGGRDFHDAAQYGLHFRAFHHIVALGNNDIAQLVDLGILFIQFPGEFLKVGQQIPHFRHILRCGQHIGKAAVFAVQRDPRGQHGLPGMEFHHAVAGGIQAEHLFADTGRNDPLPFQIVHMPADHFAEFHTADFFGVGIEKLNEPIFVGDEDLFFDIVDDPFIEINVQIAVIDPHSQRIGEIIDILNIHDHPGGDFVFIKKQTEDLPIADIGNGTDIILKL